MSGRFDRTPHECHADDLARFCCLNPDCPDHGKRGAGNLTVRARYGPHHRRLLRCRTCKARFSERKGTPLFDARLPDDKAPAVLAHVAEGFGIRQTARLTGVHTDTVTRYARLAGDHAGGSTTSWSPFPPRTDEVQFDEKWAFVGKKEKNCDRPTPADDCRGDCWDHVALDPDSRLVAGGRGRQADGRTTPCCCWSGTSRGRGWPGDAELITPRRVPGVRGGHPGGVRRDGGAATDGPAGPPGGAAREPPAGLTYATVHKERENNRVVRVRTRVVFGTAAAVARRWAAGSGREHVLRGAAQRDGPAPQRRKGRKTYGFSKDWDVHEAVTCFTHVQLQLLLAGADPAGEGRAGALAEADAGDGRRASRSRLDAHRMGHPTCYSTVGGHHQRFRVPRIRVLGEDLQRPAPERRRGGDGVVQPAFDRNVSAEQRHGEPP